MLILIGCLGGAAGVGAARRFASTPWIPDLFGPLLAAGWLLLLFELGLRKGRGTPASAVAMVSGGVAPAFLMFPLSRMCKGVWGQRLTFASGVLMLVAIVTTLIITAFRWRRGS